MSEAVENPGFGREGPGALRRRWSDAEKRRIVVESYQPGVSVSLVARRNDVNANLVFNPDFSRGVFEALDLRVIGLI